MKPLTSHYVQPLALIPCNSCLVSRNFPSLSISVRHLFFFFGSKRRSALFFNLFNLWLVFPYPLRGHTTPRVVSKLSFFCPRGFHFSSGLGLVFQLFKIVTLLDQVVTGSCVLQCRGNLLSSLLNGAGAICSISPPSSIAPSFAITSTLSLPSVFLNSALWHAQHPAEFLVYGLCGPPPRSKFVPIHFTSPVHSPLMIPLLSSTVLGPIVLLRRQMKAAN